MTAYDEYLLSVARFVYWYCIVIDVLANHANNALKRVKIMLRDLFVYTKIQFSGARGTRSCIRVYGSGALELEAVPVDR